jgi:hypothetical protein
MPNSAAPAETGPLLPLLPGDLIHVYDFDVTDSYEGVVDVTAPHLDVLWIRTNAGDRKLIDASQCKIQRID